MISAWVATPFAPCGTGAAQGTKKRCNFLSTRRNGLRPLNAGAPRRSRGALRMADAESETFQLPIISVVHEENMLCPGEIRDVALDYFFFHSILNEGGTMYGIVHADEWDPSRERSTRGVVMNVLSIENLLQNSSAETGQEDPDKLLPRILVGCRCSGRFDVQRVVDGVLAEDARPDSIVYSHVNAMCTLVRDLGAESIADRQKLATLEWDAWNACREVASLIRKLAPPKGKAPLIEQELSVWAPADYDRDISEGEWAKTPPPTREVFCRRAESFSFGVLRCMESEGEVMREARLTTSTVQRLEMAIDMAEKRQAYVKAQLSLKNTLG